AQAGALGRRDLHAEDDLRPAMSLFRAVRRWLGSAREDGPPGASTRGPEAPIEATPIWQGGASFVLAVEREGPRVIAIVYTGMHARRWACRRRVLAGGVVWQETVEPTAMDSIRFGRAAAHVLSLSEDQRIEARDRFTGALVWKHRLEGAARDASVLPDG